MTSMSVNRLKQIRNIDRIDTSLIYFQQTMQLSCRIECETDNVEERQGNQIDLICIDIGNTVSLITSFA